MSAVYGVDDPEEQLEMFNTMLLDCLNSHAPLRRVKITRPPAPWLQDQTIRSLQNRCRTERHAIQGQPSSETAWQAYGHSRNELKKTIKKSKRQFMVTALSSKRPTKVWKVIHRILNPSPQTLRISPKNPNSRFATAAERVTMAIPPGKGDLINLIDNFQQDFETPFTIQLVSYLDVLREIKCLRSDCSCGPDNIPCKIVEFIADEITSTLTHIINSCIARDYFPKSWKMARISPIPKIDNPRENSDFRLSPSSL